MKLLVLIVLACTSFITFVTAADFLNNDKLSDRSAQLGWAVSCGVISFIVVFVFIVLTRLMSDFAQKCAPFVSAFLVVWWSFGVGLLTGSSNTSGTEACSPTTRQSVFAETNNGYFAVWVSFVASIYYLYLSVEQIQNTLEGKDFVNGLVTISLASIVEFCAAADHPGHHDWAIACGILGFTVAFVQMILRSYAPSISCRTAPVVAIFLVLWWTFGVGFITSSSGPFYNTCCERANGYLASWTAFFASLYYCFKTLIDYDQPAPIVLDEPEKQSFAPRNVSSSSLSSSSASSSSSSGSSNSSNLVHNDEEYSLVAEVS